MGVYRDARKDFVWQKDFPALSAILYREQVLHILADVGIKPYAMVMGLNHAPRVLVNDFAPSNPYPSARAISFPRDSNLGQYLK